MHVLRTDLFFFYSADDDKVVTFSLPARVL